MARFPEDVIYHFESDEKGTKVTLTNLTELVRCKDCLFKYEPEGGKEMRDKQDTKELWCEYWESVTPYYGFCHEGRMSDV